MSGAPIVNVPGVLRRRLGLILLVLYGTGITIGAGIYVLVGAVAGFAGPYTPWSFLLAAAVMTLTVASYTELSTRFPASAGEAVYVKAAFEIRWLSTVTGLITVGIGIVSSSTVVVGAVGYIQQFVDLPAALVIIVVVVVLGAVAAWGILESVLLASLFTLIEVGGLLAIIVAAVHARLPILPALTPPPLEGSVLSGIAFASLLAFFAFVGFEDLANVVEEAKTPRRLTAISRAPWC
jgi:amino acid transporter